MIEVEICVDSLESGVAAAEGGCTRLELCAALSEGGLTPTPALLRALKKCVSVPIFCMVRCRGGAMVYSSDEVELMVEEAADLIAAGADGLVYGAITSDGLIDTNSCALIKKVSGSLPCTFHRAFDLLREPVQQLETVIFLGYSRVLTSGCCNNAVDGSSIIRLLVAAAGDRCAVMAGAGVKSSNVATLIQTTAVSCVHASAKVARRCDGGSSEVRMGAGDDTLRWVADAREVRALVTAATSILRS